jgi:hypothetical protein
VLNPYPSCPEGYAEYALFPGDEEPVRLSAIHGAWLHELAERFALVWATGTRCSHGPTPKAGRFGLGTPGSDPVGLNRV